MQVFEFYFNPKAKADLIFDSFCYEPENIYEKRKGSLYLTGFLKNVLPKNTKFLDNLANLIKQEYYSPFFKLPEKSLKESLRKTNEFLENIAKKGDVSWLGNLGFAALSISSFIPQRSNGKELNFTKVGNLKIFLLRDGQIIDIDKKLKFNDIEPYPLKIFSNIVSGKLVENDIILMLSQEVADTFFQENILTEIANTAVFNRETELGKRLKTIFIAKKEKLLKISGICLLIVLDNKTSASRQSFTKKEQTLLEEKGLKLIKKFRAPLARTLNRIAQNPKLKKNLITILILLLFLLLGFFVFY